MLLDVLSELPELKICTAYELDGRRVTDFPSHVEDLRQVVPVYETLPGWQAGITARPPHGRSADAGAKLSRSAQPAVGPPGGVGFRRARPRANDLRLTMSTPTPSDGQRTARGAAGKDAPARRRHHGRQRPLGPAARPAADRGASPRRARAFAASPRNVPGWASGSSRSTAFPARTGSGPQEELDFLMQPACSSTWSSSATPSWSTTSRWW